MDKFRIGHTGITWGYGAAQMEEALRDTAELGYRAFETFGSVLEQFERDRPGGFGALLQRYGIPLSAAYCGTAFYDPAQGEADVEQVAKWAEVAKSLGATTIVLQGGQRREEPYTQWEGMASVFNEIARRVAALGMITALHPHTGTLIETEAEIDAILAAVDPRLVSFAPDTGQIQKGGGDAVAVLRRHKARIGHVHLKDYGGGRETGYAGYEPIGSGMIDMAAIFQVLAEGNFSGWVMVELDSTPSAPRPPREAAAMSRSYLAKLLGDRAQW
jgi:inosose dehydratase